MTQIELFEKVMLPFILRPDHEGRYNNDPRDPGKETMCGITIATARSKGYMGPMKDLPDNLIHDWYLSDYWLATKCDKLPQFLAVITFDSATNQGPSKAQSFLQRAYVYLRASQGLMTPTIAVDGAIGPKTIAAVGMVPKNQLNEFIVLFIAERGNDYGLQDAIDDVFGLGWNRRLARCHQLALSFA